jgi:outer membrane biosynthesis protein TonB
VNGGGLKGQQFYLDSLVKAFAFSMALHLALFAGSELSRLLFRRSISPRRTLNSLASSSVASPASSGKAPREVSIVFIESSPIRETGRAAPAQTASADEAGATQRPPATAPVETAPPESTTVSPLPNTLPQLASKTPPNTPPEQSQAERTTPNAARDNAPSSPASAAEKPNEKPVAENLAGRGQEKVAPTAVEPTVSAPRRPNIEIDLKGAPFGNYDSKLIATVQKRWHQLLDQRKAGRDESGRVVVEFRLKYDGHVSDLKIVRREVDFVPAWDCQRAVGDSAPFPPWPREMHRIIGANYRSVRFTFAY